MNNSTPKPQWRQTSGRDSLLSAFRQQRAWTARELHAAVPELDLATIYRNLKTLAKRGLVASVTLRGTEQRYEIADRKHHAHRVCDRCQRAECVPCPIRGNSSHHLEFTGTCNGCR